MRGRPPDPGGRHRLTREERERLRGRRLRLPRLRLPGVPGSRLVQVLGGSAGLVLLVLVLTQLLSGPAPPPEGAASADPAARAWSERVEENVREAALELGMREEWVLVHEPGTPEGDSLLTVVEFRVPGDLHLEILNLHLTRAVHEAGGEIVRGIELHDARVELEAAFKGRRTHRLVLQRYSGYRRAAGRLAIIIDDFGLAPLQVLEGLTRLGVPWTAAVIPGLSGSREQAELLAARRIPLMVHLPMEPEDGAAWDLGAGAIYASTPAAAVDRLLERALEDVPGARGVNNHMGSRATTQPPVMRALMRSLRERDLYFVDSVTSPRTVGPDEAARAGVLWARRDVFLDPEDDPAVIREQMERALAEAAGKGRAVVIGHPRPNTLAALRSWIPRARERGYEFVTVDRLLRRSGRQ
ncbi:MAG: divergent polysaccharide deacetylase family protein [bacterium]